jgi:hypothetical protein
MSRVGRRRRGAPQSDVWTRLIFWATLLVKMGHSHAQGVWTVLSGDSACELSPNGLCVNDGDGDYGNDESCTVHAEVDITVSAQGGFEMEADHDYVTIGGTQYSLDPPLRKLGIKKSGPPGAPPGAKKRPRSEDQASNPPYPCRPETNWVFRCLNTKILEKSRAARAKDSHTDDEIGGGALDNGKVRSPCQHVEPT